MTDINSIALPEAIQNSSAPSTTSHRLSPGQELNLEKYDLLPIKKPRSKYLILSSQRTGSNYLCRRLCNVHDRFGLPSEYLNPEHSKLITSRVFPGHDLKQLPNLANYMTAVERLRTSEDGMFGIKVQPAQLLTFTKRNTQLMLKFVAQFDRLVLMSRRDKLGQAISGAIAQTTKTWFNDGNSPVLNKLQYHSIVEKIARNLSRYIAEERFIFDIGRKFTKSTLRIEYEEIEYDGEAVFKEVTDFLSGGTAGVLSENDELPIPEKGNSNLAQELREIFISSIQNGNLRDTSKFS